MGREFVSFLDFLNIINKEHEIIAITKTPLRNGNDYYEIIAQEKWGNAQLDRMQEDNGAEVRTTQIKVELIVEVRHVNFDDLEETQSFNDNYMKDLILHSNEIGDTVGEIVKADWSFVK